MVGGASASAHTTHRASESFKTLEAIGNLTSVTTIIFCPVLYVSDISFGGAALLRALIPQKIHSPRIEALA